MNYKDLYFELFRASEKAINILIEAQQKCEEKILSENESENVVSILDYEKN